MKANKRFPVLCIMIAFILLLTACATGKTTQPEREGFTPKLDSHTEGSITVAGHYSNFEALEAEFARFATYYPNVKLTYTYLDGFSKILSTALTSAEAPDIFFTYPWMGDWTDGEQIFAASENLADPTLGIDLGCVRENLLKTDDKGQVLSVPIYTTTYGMLVNEDLFQKENIPVPSTYSELLAACDAFQKAGYAAPILGYNKSGDLLYPLYYPYFCGQIQGNEAALAELNTLKPEAGEHLRKMLELTTDFMSRGYLDLAACNALKDNYDAVIMRFFEGDVPMMLATGNTVSGTEKREAKSEAFTQHPFRYSFHPVPSTEQGGYFVNTVSIGFAVNRNSANLDLANEFMRFLVSTNELNLMAKAKRMVTPCADMSLDSVYAPFEKLDSSRMINLSELGLSDDAASQVSRAGWQVSNGLMSVDEAIAAYGTIE